MNYNSVAAGVVLNFVSLKTACPLWRSVCCTGAVCNLILQFYRGYDSTSKGVRSIIRVDCSIINTMLLQHACADYHRLPTSVVT